MGPPAPPQTRHSAAPSAASRTVITPYDNKRQDCFYLLTTINDRLWATH